MKVSTAASSSLSVPSHKSTTPCPFPRAFLPKITPLFTTSSHIFLLPLVFRISPLVSRLSVSLVMLICMCTFRDTPIIYFEGCREITTLARWAPVEQC